MLLENREEVETVDGDDAKEVESEFCAVVIERDYAELEEEDVNEVGRHKRKTTAQLIKEKEDQVCRKLQLKTDVGLRVDENMAVSGRGVRVNIVKIEVSLVVKTQTKPQHNQKSTQQKFDLTKQGNL